jgi:acyl carrier protein
MKTKEEVFAIVQQVVAGHIGCFVDNVIPDATFEELGADSLDQVELIIALEIEFDVEIDDNAGEQADTVGKMVDCVMNALAR